MARTSGPSGRKSGTGATADRHQAGSNPGGSRQGHHHGHIVSQAPGRMRVRLHRGHRDPSELARIEGRLVRRDGIQAVATNTRTGSVLVHYDRRALSKDDLVAMLYDVGVAAREVLGAEDVPEDLGREPAPHSAPAIGLMDALSDLDQRVSRLTGGKLDVKVLVPAGLGLLALRQILSTGLGLADVPGYVLLWYTFDSFYKLHQRKTATAIASTVGEIAAGQVAGATDGHSATTESVTTETPSPG